MKVKINGQDIKFTSLEWKGSKYNAARQITVNYPSNLAYKFKQGNTVTIYDGTKQLFKGNVFRMEKSYKNDEIEFIAYDRMIYFLNSSGSFNFKTITIGNYIKKIASSVGVSVGSLADSNTIIKLSPQLNINLYDAILEGYRLVKKKTKKIYLPVIKDNQLTVKTAGEIVKGLELANKINLLDSVYSETIENVVNKVIIINEKGTKIGQVTGEGLNTWGTFQGVYEKEKGVNSVTEAKKMLHGLDREVSVEALGDTRCISGKAVTIKDKETGLNGLFYIDEDSHRWEGNNYTMSLSLNFKNIMEDT